MKNEIHIPRVHPGRVLQDELDEIGVSQSALAEHIGVAKDHQRDLPRKARNKRRDGMEAIASPWREPDLLA